jgi:hypothetical protein
MEYFQDNITKVVFGKTVSHSSTMVNSAYDSLMAFRDANYRKYTAKVVENIWSFPGKP